MTKKVCILVDCLSFGGAEKVAANLSISLFNKGYDITLVSMIDNISYPFKGKLFNFGKVKKNSSKLNALLVFSAFFRNEKFDIIIDHRVRNKFFKELLFSKLIFNKSKVIYCIHNYLLSYSFCFVSFPYLAHWPHVKNRVFVSVCKEVNKHVEEKLRIKSKTIYNYIRQRSHVGFEKENYIIGVGRLTQIKQFDKLILAYSESELPQRNIKLVILGDGEEKDNLRKLITKLELTKEIKLISFKDNPEPLIAKARALALVSKVEGFGMVLLEALSLGTPVVAFNCKSGPSEIIQNEINGLLVEDQNHEKLIEALNKLVLDEDFYDTLKNNSQKGLEKFSEEQVIQQWVSILESDT